MFSENFYNKSNYLPLMLQSMVLTTWLVRMMQSTPSIFFLSSIIDNNEV